MLALLGFFPLSLKTHNVNTKPAKTIGAKTVGAYVCKQIVGYVAVSGSRLLLKKYLGLLVAGYVSVSANDILLVAGSWFQNSYSPHPPDWHFLHY